jgi:hypothetical protein
MQSTIYDIIVIHQDAALRYGASGLVVMAKLNRGESPPNEGDEVLLVRPDGWAHTVIVADIRPHVDSFAFFIADLKPSDVVLETRIQWGESVKPALQLLSGGQHLLIHS